MPKRDSIFLEKLNVLKQSEYLEKDTNQAQKTYAGYSNQYLKASEDEKEWMDRNSDYLLNKIRTLEKKYWN